MTIFCISDLHLSANQPALVKHFVHFMRNIAPASSALYILGDLFDAWAGDDMSADAVHSVSEAMLNYSKSGRYLGIMRGNRDFLLTEQYCSQVGAELLPDPLIRQLGGVDTLLSHGDQYCTDDISYQRFRRIVQHPLPQALYYRTPKAIRQQVVDYLRSGSNDHKQHKSIDIMDVNSNAIQQAFVDAKVERMIHGHTHRPAIHANAQTRVVLGDWYVTPDGSAVGNLLQISVDGQLNLGAI